MASTGRRVNDRHPTPRPTAAHLAGRSPGRSAALDAWFRRTGCSRTPPSPRTSLSSTAPQHGGRRGVLPGPPRRRAEPGRGTDGPRLAGYRRTGGHSGPAAAAVRGRRTWPPPASPPSRAGAAAASSSTGPATPPALARSPRARSGAWRGGPGRGQSHGLLRRRDRQPVRAHDRATGRRISCRCHPGRNHARRSNDLQAAADGRTTAGLADHLLPPSSTATPSSDGRESQGCRRGESPVASADLAIGLDRR